MNNPLLLLILVLTSNLLTWLASTSIVDWLASPNPMPLNYFLSNLVSGAILGFVSFKRAPHSIAIWIGAGLLGVPFLYWSLFTLKVILQSGTWTTFHMTSNAYGDVLTYFLYFSLPVTSCSFLACWILRRNIQ